MANCFQCTQKIGFGTVSVEGKKLKETYSKYELHDELIERMGDKDKLCFDCAKSIDIKNAEQVVRLAKKRATDEEFEQYGNWISKEAPHLWDAYEKFRTESKNSIINSSNKNNDAMIESSPKQSKKLADITSVDELTRLTDVRHDEFKKNWQKNRVVQFKNDKIAILMRAHASQVQFIVAFDQVTREGFRLMAIDEGKEVQAGNFGGGTSSYYYFQKMDYVR